MKVKAPRRARASTPALQRTTHRFPVEGLDCSACGADLRLKLRELPGVQAINVNVSASEIAVTFDPDRVDPPTIQGKLDTLGLGCSEL